MPVDSAGGRRRLPRLGRVAQGGQRVVLLM